MKEAIVNQAQEVIDRVARYSAPLLASLALTPAVTTGVARAEGSNGTGGTAPVAAMRLRSIRQLPGYHMDVTKNEVRQLEDATVKMGVQPEPYANTSNLVAGGEWCTGLNVNFPGTNNSYVMTNAHCFEAITGNVYGVIFDLNNSSDTAENYIDYSQYQFSILDPKIPATVRDQFPLGVVDGLSIDTDGVDTALMNVAPDNGSKESGPPSTYSGEPSYHDYQAVSFNQLANSGKQEEPGQQVAMYGIPVASGNKPIATTGRYLGRYMYKPDPYYYSWPIDVVAVKAESPATDACEHGSSGGSAELADGDITGGLGSRLSTGYGPNHIYSEPLDSPKFDQTQIGHIEKALDVRIPAGDTVCGYTVLPKNVGYTLLSGFNTYYTPPNPPLKGGGPGMK